MIGEAVPDKEGLRRRAARLSLAQKVRLLTGADFWALYAEPEAGLRRVVLCDGPAGVRGETWDERDTSANVPSPTALAATWAVSASSPSAGCSRTRRGARASTCCSPPP